MPFVINLLPGTAPWYLQTLTARDGAIAVGRSGGAIDAALPFDSFDTARSVAAALRGWPDARVEEVAAPAVPAADPTCVILLDPENEVYLHAAVACADGWLRAVGGCRENAMRFVNRDAATRLRHLVSGYPHSCII